MDNINFDEFGPEKIIEVYNPKVGMRGFLVLDNLSLGPCKGGTRMTATVSVQEIARLARTMTWKCAMADLPFGGGKSGIIADDRNLSQKKKDEIISAFGEALKIVCPDLYVGAPDMNMGEHEMEIFANAVGSKKACTGKPKRMGGLPHELGSTGFGVFHSFLIAAKHLNKDVKKMTIAIEGFGNVGYFAAKYAAEYGCKIAAVSDSRGVIYNNKGLDFNKLAEVKKNKGTVTLYSEGKVLPSNHILEVDADVLITAAVPDLIKIGDVDKLKFKMIVEGSNIPTTQDVEEILHRKGILVVPDFVANAGGVISSYVEYAGGNESRMFKLVKSKITKNTEIVLNNSKKLNISPREAALRIAKERVRKKCKVCSV